MTTTTRAQALAAQFEAANQEVLAAVEALDEGTTVRSKAEGWPVFFAAWHIADGHTTVMELISLVAGGQPLPPVTQELLDAGNAANLAQHGACSRAEALAALRRHGETTAAAIRALPDAELDRTATLDLLGGATMTVQHLIERVLIGHTRNHLASLRAAA